MRPGTRVRNVVRGNRQVGVVIDPDRVNAVLAAGYVLVQWRPGDSHVIERTVDLCEVSNPRKDLT